MTEPKLILVVDDEEMNVELMIDVLDDEGYKTETAENGQQALSKFKEIKPDLVLLDVMMPILDGYETCRQMRELEKDTTDLTPIIFLSAKAGLEDKLKGYEVGGDDYITKPFDVGELMVKVDVILQKKKQIEELKSNTTQAQSLTFQMMTSAAKVGEIGRFLQNSLSCRNIEQLSQYFFELALNFELGCTLKIRDKNGWVIKSSDGIDRPLDIEIIKNYKGQEKIFHFGKNRALFNWGEIALLVRNVGDEADNIAIMLDGLLAGYKSILAQNMVLSSIEEFRQRNRQLKISSASALDDLTDELKLFFSEMGTGTSLSEADEEKISSIVQFHREYLDNILKESSQIEKMLENSLSEFASLD